MTVSFLSLNTYILIIKVFLLTDALIVKNPGIKEMNFYLHGLNILRDSALLILILAGINLFFKQVIM